MLTHLCPPSINDIASSVSGKAITVNSPSAPDDTPTSSLLTSQATVTSSPQLHSISFSREPSASDLSDESQSSKPPSAVDSLSEANSSETNLQQLSYIRFECGCGKCSVYDYISGKICPNPKELPFPKLDVSDIPPQEIEYIEEELRYQSISLYREFCYLVVDTFEKLRDRVDFSDLISYLTLI